MAEGEDWIAIDVRETRLSPDIASAAAAFAATRALVCHDALDPALLARVAAICDRAAFKSDQVEGLGHRRIEQPAIAGNTLALLLRRAPLFRWLEAVTGRIPINDVEGRVVETHAQGGEGLIWHDDIAPRRRLAVTIALGDQPYQGGDFELRHRTSRDLLLRFHHDRPGTMLVFDVATDCVHRVKPLTGGGPRRVFAGWFLG